MSLTNRPEVMSKLANGEVFLNSRIFLDSDSALCRRRRLLDSVGGAWKRTCKFTTKHQKECWIPSFTLPTFTHGMISNSKTEELQQISGLARALKLIPYILKSTYVLRP
jgi:hypothetical protein